MVLADDDAAALVVAVVETTFFLVAGRHCLRTSPWTADRWVLR